MESNIIFPTYRLVSFNELASNSRNTLTRHLQKSGPPSTKKLQCQIYQRTCRSRIRLLATRDNETHRVYGCVHTCVRVHYNNKK